MGQNPKKVSGGLIHDWMGAVFVPNLKLDDILKVTRDYDHYKEFYRPSVVESKAIARDGPPRRAERWRAPVISRRRITPDAIFTSASANTPWAPY